MHEFPRSLRPERRRRLALLVTVSLALLPGSASTLGPTGQASPTSAETIALDQPLPVGPFVTVGTLDNGLRYYIRENREPENRAELRLVVNAGSVLEDDDQRGLAHFVEHMAFNGSEHFAKQELVDFVESIGMSFGPGLNASTSFDETIYMLRIPTDSAEVMETAVQILEDWSHGVTFEVEEIDKERGVVIEEWRLGQGARTRMRDRQYPVLFRGSRYAERLPIGNREALETFDPASLTRFYRDWYRPDLMAVVAVGDFDRAVVQTLIERHFASLVGPEEPRPRIVPTVPDHDETRFAIATDPEATRTRVAVYHKLPSTPQGTAGAYRQLIVDGLYDGMLNQRFDELAQSPDPPFLSGSSGRGRLVRSKEVYALQAGVPADGIERGLAALFTEGERVLRYGFTAAELERQKRDVLRSLERAYTERQNRDSGSYAAEYIRAFLEDEPIPGIAYELTLYQRFLPEITLDELDRLARDRMTDRNRVVLVNTPRTPDVEVPSERRLAAVLEGVADETITAYVDTVSDAPLVPEPPAPTDVVDTRTIEPLDITEWTLANGVRVILKPTDFQEDEVLVRAFSPGGTSLASDADYVSAQTAGQVIAAGGLGSFSAIDLDKRLSGTVATVRPIIEDLEEGLSGSASPTDLETLFQLIYLTFTAPRADPAIFEVLRDQMRAGLANRDASPEVAFRDAFRSAVSQDRFRARPMTVERVEEMDLETSARFYRDRFADAGDFSFVFVGNLDLDRLRPLVSRYLGGLPSIARAESWRDPGIDLPSGVVRETVRKGLEPKSQTGIVFPGPFEFDRPRRVAIRALGMVLETRLREILREDLGGTYGVSVGTSTTWRPDEEYTFSIGFGSDPERTEALTAVVFDEIERLKDSGPSVEDLDAVKATLLRDFEANQTQNAFWLNQLAFQYRLGEDPREVLTYEPTVGALTPAMIQQAARTYLDPSRYVLVTLRPEQ